MEKERVLIIGAGGIGLRHIRGFLKTGRAELSVVEPDPEKREKVTGEYAILRAAASTDDIDLSRFTAAVICAPPHLHIPLARQCAEAGIHFMIEKPLAVELAGVDELIERVRQRNLVARVGFVRRSSAELQAMRKRISAGEIGEPRMSYINVSQDYPKYRPDYREIYYARRDTGGGAILDAASHMIDLLLWFFGPVAEVCSMYDRLQLTGVECEDACLISLRFRTGILAQISINQFQKPNTCMVEVVGSSGNLLLDMSTLKFSDNDRNEWETRDYARSLSPAELHENRFALQANLFLDTIRGEPSPLCSLEEARENLRIALAAKESDRTKRIIQMKDWTDGADKTAG